MQDTNLTILKLEGLGDLSHSQCLIYSNSELIDRIYPLSPIPSTIRLSTNETKIILIDSPSTLPVCSVSFNLSIFSSSGLNWLPLFLNDEDLLTSVPEEVGLPRILINVTPAILTPVLELTESSDTMEENLEDLPTDGFSQLKSKNTELMIKVMDLESALNTERRQFEEEVEKIEKGFKGKIAEFSKDNEKLRTNSAVHARELADRIKEVRGLQEKVRTLTEEKAELFSKVERYEQLYEDVKLREDSILMLLEEKDKEILRCERKRKENFSVCGQDGSGVKRVGVVGEGLDLTKRSENKGISRFKVLEKVDERIKKTLKVLNLDGLLKLSEEFIYVLGSKKVNIVCKKDVIYVKSGAGNLKTLEAFISNSCSQDIQAFLSKKKIKAPIPSSLHRRSSTLSDLEQLPNSIISKTFDTRINTQHKSYKKVLNSTIGKSSSPLNKNRTTRNI